MNYGKTTIVVCDSEADLGHRAAQAVAVAMRDALKKRGRANIILAGGQSQSAFLTALARCEGLDWSSVVCFNMDEFWQPGMPERCTVGDQVRRELYDHVQPGQVHLLDADAPDPHAEADRFESLLADVGTIDILCEGIGTSGHLAFNEPGQTDFGDPRRVRVVDVTEASRRQLAADPNFRDLPEIPRKGITMTIPTLMSARQIFTIVPLGLKRPILTRLAETTEPTRELPASILLRHEGLLLVDRDSCPPQWADNA
jgi:glucosamine-6-phosphate deaminase